MEQSKITGLLKSRSLRQQHLHVGPALAASRKCRHIVQIIVIVQDPLQQVADGGEGSQITVMINTL